MLARAQLAIGDLTAARQSFSFIIKHRFSTFHKGLAYLWPLAHYHLGLVETEAGNVTAAAQQFETFLDLWADADGGVSELEDARQRLQQLRSE
jgi:hypothetical protein